MKYIIFDNKYPIVFPDEVIHCDLDIVGLTPTSAGHMEFQNGEIRVFGESESLGLKWKDGDATIINNLFVLRIK